MSILKFLMLLSLVVWLGGVIFFGAVLAPTVFSVLPTRHLAGSVVSPSLNRLHWMGLISGVVFLVSSLIYTRVTTGSLHVFTARHVLIVVMLLLTLTSQFAITPKMATLRASMGEIDNVSPTDPARLHFNSLHIWSTRLEMGVLLSGLVVVYLTATQLK
jgi:Domain of unknown function (DUF4149)